MSNPACHFERLSSEHRLFKSLTDSLKTLVTLEREAWQIDKGGGDATYDDLLAVIHGEQPA